MYDPDIIPFAIALGKRVYARRVKGIDSAAKSVGGMTRRNLI